MVMIYENHQSKFWQARCAILIAVALLIVLPNVLILGRHVAHATYLYSCI